MAVGAFPFIWILNYNVESFLKVDLGWAKPRPSTPFSWPNCRPRKTISIISSPASDDRSVQFSYFSIVLTRDQFTDIKWPQYPILGVSKSNILKPDVILQKDWRVEYFIFYTLLFRSWFLAQIYVVLVSWTSFYGPDTLSRARWALSGDTTLQEVGSIAASPV